VGVKTWEEKVLDSPRRSRYHVTQAKVISYTLGTRRSHKKGVLGGGGKRNGREIEGSQFRKPPDDEGKCTPEI